MSKPLSQFIRIDDAAALLGVSRSTMYRWKKRPDFPAAYKLTERTVLYRIADLQEYIEAKVV